MKRRAPGQKFTKRSKYNDCFDNGGRSSNFDNRGYQRSQAKHHQDTVKHDFRRDSSLLSSGSPSFLPSNSIYSRDGVHGSADRRNSEAINAFYHLLRDEDTRVKNDDRTTRTSSSSNGFAVKDKNSFKNSRVCEVDFWKLDEALKEKKDPTLSFGGNGKVPVSVQNNPKRQDSAILIGSDSRDDKSWRSYLRRDCWIDFRSLPSPPNHSGSGSVSGSNYNPLSSFYDFEHNTELKLSNDCNSSISTSKPQPKKNIANMLNPNNPLYNPQVFALKKLTSDPSFPFNIYSNNHAVKDTRAVLLQNAAHLAANPIDLQNFIAAQYQSRYSDGKISLHPVISYSKKNKKRLDMGTIYIEFVSHEAALLAQKILDGSISGSISGSGDNSNAVAKMTCSLVKDFNGKNPFTINISDFIDDSGNLKPGLTL